MRRGGTQPPQRETTGASEAENVGIVWISYLTDGKKTEGFDDKITTLSSTHKTNQQKRIFKPCIFTHKELEVVVLQDKKGISARSG